MTTEMQPNEAVEDDKPASFTLGLLVFVTLIAVLIFIGYSVRNLLMDEQQLPIQQIVFTGNLEALDRQVLENKIRHEFRQSFFSLDVNQVHDVLEQEPWVYRVSIRKRWPNALLIHVVEQRPVAFWNADALLNEYGDTFVGEFEKDKALPSLHGPQGSEKTALTGYKQMQSLLSASEQRIHKVYLSERFSWEVELTNDVMLKLGRQEHIDRLQRFIDYYPVIVAQQKPIDYIDLRYDTGLAVGWNTVMTDSEVQRGEM